MKGKIPTFGFDSTTLTFQDASEVKSACSGSSALSLNSDKNCDADSVSDKHLQQSKYLDTNRHGFVFQTRAGGVVVCDPPCQSLWFL
jgi:hypothetical protein